MDKDFETRFNYDNRVCYRKVILEYNYCLAIGDFSRARELLSEHGGIIDLQAKCAYQNETQKI